MKAAKQKKLEAAGFRVGDAAEFLELTPEEIKLVDLRLKVSRLVRTFARATEYLSTTTGKTDRVQSVAGGEVGERSR